MSLACGAVQVQSSWFLNGLGSVDRLELAKKLTEASQNAFDGDPAIIPLPNEVPIEAPIIILKSKDDTLQLNVAHTRVDFFSKPPALRTEGHQLLLPLDKLGAIVDVLSLSSVVLRQAIISLWASQPSEGGAAYISRYYLQPDSLVTNAASAEVHLLHKVHVANIASNRWTRLRSLSTSDSKDDLLTILIDINSVPAKTQTFDRRTSSEFLGAAADHTRNVIEGLKC